MAYINKIQTPANNTYDIHASGIPYAQVDDTSTATDFTATVPGITSLEDGTCVLLKNGQVTSASGFTININGLGDKPCYNNLTTGYGTTAPTRDTTIFNINYTMLFIYSSDIVDGGGWICYRGYDANTNTIGYQLRTNSGNLEASDTGYKYRLWFTSADGKKWVPANTSTATNATTTRTMNTRPINPFGPIVYNSTNGTTNAGARPAVTTLWQQYTLTIGYSYVVSLTAWDPVYVQCTPQTNGSAVMNAIVKALPTSDDGKIYIYLGIAYSTTAMELRTEHPVFYHDGNGIKLWTGTKIPSKTSDLTNDSGFITSADVPEGSVASTTTPKMDGTAAVGTETAFARGDHVHPTDTSRASTATFSTSANGLVPKPNSAATNSYLNSSGTWTTPPNTTYALATTAANGLLSNQMYSLLENNAIGADESSIDGINAVNGYQIHLSLANLQGDDYILEDYATIPSATTATYGVVKPDGTTITVDGNGVISSSGGGGGSTPLIGTTATLTPTQVKTALRAGTDICLEYHGAFDQVPVDFRFTSWNGATDDVNGVALDAVVSNTIVYYNDNYYLFDLTGIIASGGTTLNSWFLHNTNLGGGSGGFRHIAEDTVCGAVKLGDISTLTATGDNSVAQGSFSAAIGDQSHAEGNESSAYGPGSHAEGILTHAYGSGSHAQGETTTVTNDGNAAHAEGKNTQASSTASHAEGNGTTASGAQSHAEGYYSLASTATAHAEGDNTTASGYASHAQGVGNIASSAQAFAGGYHSTASHSNSFVHGMNLKTSHSEQAVFGQFNADDSTAFLLVGRGSSDADADRRNAFAVHTDGRASAGANATASEDLVRLGQILDLQVNTVSGDVTCSNGSWCTPTSVQLNSTGLYLVSAHVQFASSSAGRRTIILTSSPSGSTGNLMNHQCIDARAPVNGDKTTCSIVTILNVTQANYKIYCRAWQNSGSTRTVTGSLRAVKLK